MSNSLDVNALYQIDAFVAFKNEFMSGEIDDHLKYLESKAEICSHSRDTEDEAQGSNPFMSDWCTVRSRRPFHVHVYKEMKTGIHYILSRKELDRSQKDDYIWVRAVVQIRPNHFVFAEGHYSSDGDLSVQGFSDNYIFVRSLDYKKIETVSFAEDDPRLVFSVYRVVFQMQQT